MMGAGDLRTYYATAQVSGPSGGGPSGTDKAMLTLLNPAGSGKIVRVFMAEYFTLSSSGTNVYIDVQLRRITAHTGGSAITPIKRDAEDSNASAEVRSEPSVTGGDASDILQQLVIQSNAPQSGEAYRFKFGTCSCEKPIVLSPGEGIVVHQVTGNGGTFCPGLVWTES